MTSRTQQLMGDEGSYQADWTVGRTEVGGDAMFYTSLDASVDGQGGQLRDNPVFTVEQAAAYLNRGAGPQLFDGVYYNSGANWAGAQGTAGNDWYYLATSKTNGGEAHDAATAARLGLPATGPTGPLTSLNYGFYETVATLPDPYVFTRQSDGTSALYIGDARVNGFSAFSPAQRDATRQAIEAWDDLIAINFVETHFSQGDINFMNTTTGPAQASAFLPYGSSTSTVIIQDDGSRVTTYERVGDVFVNPAQASNQLFDEGQYGLTTLIHEIGHSLGLEHPGAYNFGPGFSVTYENGAEYYQDSAQYSIMSYWDAEETGANRVDWEFMTYRYSSTPSVHDVAAIQRIYGADMTTRTGDNVYGFNTTEAAFGSFDFANNMFPVVTIWDAGGNDTLDLSGFVTTSIIDLNPGQFTSAGGFYSEDIPTLASINARRAEAGLTPRTQAQYDLYVSLFSETYTNGLLSDNIAIAYGAIIENAVGGGGDDVITGNSVANILAGNAGNDTLLGGFGDDSLLGGAGDDILDGGDGTDTATYSNAAAAVTVNLTVTSAQATGGAGLDTLTAIENLTGSAYSDMLTGNDAANALIGSDGSDTLIGLGGNDVLSGGAGNDILRGGDGLDVITLGAGNDVFVGEVGAAKVATKLGAMPVDIITDFNAAGDDFIDLSALGTTFNFRGTNANKNSGDLTFKTFTSVNGAEKALGFDIDGVPGASGVSGPVTIVFGNTDGGAADFAIVLLNTSSVTESDFILRTSIANASASATFELQSLANTELHTLSYTIY